MRIFYVDAEIGDPQGERYETVRALVDSGAAYTILPTSLLNTARSGKSGNIRAGRIVFRSTAGWSSVMNMAYEHDSDLGLPGSL